MIYQISEGNVHTISGTYKFYGDDNAFGSDDNQLPNEKIDQHEKGHNSSPKTISDDPPRKQWRCRKEFLFASIAGCLGSTDLWKFPFAAREFGGGGAFFLIYILLTASFAMPMCLVESIPSQYAGLGTLSVWNLAPISKGIGISSLLIIVLLLPCNCAPLAYNIFYVASSFQSLLPWSSCFDWWGADNKCYNKDNISNETQNATVFNWTSSPPYLPSQEYLEKYMLKQDGSEDISHIGSIPWHLLLCLLCTWLIIFACVSQGIRSVGIIVTYTVPFVYVALLLMMIRVAIVDGGLDGIAYFFTPNWADFLNFNLWVAAAQQLIFILGVSSGAKAAFASHNVFHHKIQIDAWLLWAATLVANIIMSMLVYAVIGAMAKLTETSIDQVPVPGSFRLSYIFYPEVIGKALKIPQLWSVIFYVTQFIMRIVYQFCMVLVIYIALQDVWPSMRKRQTWWILGICLFLFLFSIPAITKVTKKSFITYLIYLKLNFKLKGGYHVTDLINNYTYVWVRFVILLCEEIAVCGIYGIYKAIVVFFMNLLNNLISMSLQMYENSWLT
ncbi:transporter, variant 4 [Chamberlinius hualienensis]